MIQGTIAGTPIVLGDTVYSTGSIGYQATGKMVLDGKMYQMNCMLVQVGSGDDADAPARAAQVKAAREAKAEAAKRAAARRK